MSHLRPKPESNDLLRVERKVDHLHDLLHELIRVVSAQGIIMAASLEALTAEVERNTNTQQSAIVLLNGLSAQILAIKTDPVALQALAGKLANQSTELAAAIVANTPAE